MNEHDFSQRALDLKKGDISTLRLELMEKAKAEADRAELLAALKELADSPITHLTGYKAEVDAAMERARAAIQSAEA